MYGVLYGQNAFVFNVAITTLEVSVGSHDFRRFESWVRVLSTADMSPGSGSGSGPRSTSSSSSISPLGPITSATAAYLRSATLLFVYPIFLGTKDLAQLVGVVDKAAQTLRSTVFGADLRIHIQAAPKAHKQYDTLHVDVLDVDCRCRESKGTTHGIRVSVEDPKLSPPGRASKVESTFHPLLKLRAAGKPSISGNVSEDFARRLEESIAANAIGSSSSAR